jgi:hypothetical protein
MHVFKRGSKETMKHSVTYLTGIWMVSLALLFFSCTRKDEITQFNVLGTDPVDSITVVEERSQSFLNWAKSDVKGVVLVHVDPHDSLEAVIPARIQEIGNMVEHRQWDKIAQGRGDLIKNSNYLYAAVATGIVNKIYWVIPNRLFEDIPLAKEKIQDFLRTSPSKFREDEIAGMRMIEGCLTGYLAGTDIHICSPRTLPNIYVPVIISMNVGFFPVYATESKSSKLRALKWTMDYITFKQKLTVIRADISYGTRSGVTDPVHRYIGDELIEILGNPPILSAESPPELWQFRDRAENMLSGGEDSLIVEYLKEPLQKYPDDPALRLIHAAAQVRLKKYEEAFNETDALCSLDSHYCYGFVSLGKTIDDEGWQRKFFDRALAVLPDSVYVKDSVRQGDILTERNNN